MFSVFAWLLVAASPSARGYVGPTSAPVMPPPAEVEEGRGEEGDGAPAQDVLPGPADRADPAEIEEPEDPADPAEDLDDLEMIEEEEIISREVDGGLSDEIRQIDVTTDLLGGSKRIDLFRHAGGRSLVEVSESKDRGIASVGEALDRMPGVRAVEGNAGIGSTSTKLNVGVRGANPRLSSEATVMLDEVPIAPAPYGQPQLSLFPLSLFSIDRIDAVRGGSSVRFGPRTSGGVFNLISNPIPKTRASPSSPRPTSSAMQVRRPPTAGPIAASACTLSTRRVLAGPTASTASSRPTAGSSNSRTR